jgi:hypothetical protein
VILLLVWGINAITSGGTRTEATGPAADEPRIVLIALDTVSVTLVQESDRTVLFEGTLVRNESRSFPKRGTLLLTASALENIEIEMHGRRFPTNMTGRDRVRIQ